MARFRSNLHPINSVKNIVESTGNALAATNTEHSMAIAVDATTGLATDATVGSSIKSFFISLDFLSDAAPTASTDWFLAKRHTGQAFADFPAPSGVGGHGMRNQVFHQEKALAGVADGGTPMSFKGVIRVPKGMQRMREGDVWFISSRMTNAGKFCFRTIYKYYK